MIEKKNIKMSELLHLQSYYSWISIIQTTISIIWTSLSGPDFLMNTN